MRAYELVQTSTSLGQRNLKKRIAYSSISHMGFMIIRISSISDTGLYGCCTFFLTGIGYDRLHLLYLDQMGIGINLDFMSFSVDKVEAILSNFF
ncbi:hypothetical protein HN51_059969 [Arachis hypogaea]